MLIFPAQIVSHHRSYCPSWALNWEYRRQRIFADIFKHDADIVSLQVCNQERNAIQFDRWYYSRQELETGEYYNVFLPKMREHGYDGIFQ